MFLTQTHTLWGGMEWWVHRLSERLIGRGWDVYAGLAQGARFSNARTYHAAHPHLRAVVMNAKVGNESSRVRAVVRALRRVRPDVVIPVGIGASFDAIRHTDATFIVPVLSLHTGWLANVIESRDVVDVAVPNSRLLERLLRAEIDSAAVRYIRQGVPRATDPRSGRTARLRAGIVCRLEEASKRVMDLVRVADVVDERVELHVFGDGPDRARLIEALRGRASFHGYMPTEQLYRDAYPDLDVLLLFSPSEGSPNAVYEAMQNGVVPVSSRFMGWAAEGILRHEENALMFDVGDAAEAVRHLMRLADDRALLETLSESARRSVESYTDDDMYGAWIDVIESPRPRVQRVPHRTISVSGRLERMGLPSAVADAARRILRVRFPHDSGWNEWPGSQPASEATTARVSARLAEIERNAINA